MRCFILKHKGHDVADICDVAADARKELETLKEKCACVIQTWRLREDALNQSEQSLGAAVEKSLQSIENTKQELVKEIEKVCKEFEAKIARRNEEQRHELEKAKSKLSYSKESFEELQELIQKLMDTKNPSEVTKNVKQMKQNYAHLCQKDSKKLDHVTKVHAPVFQRADIADFAAHVFGRSESESSGGHRVLFSEARRQGQL